ncbi:calcium/sodium antiporter [Thiohalospira sp.]|uniref:calcium/sodium antiporter n=1 Tax=Thiohalospira sp. TaxID=3080549 RepID=UPI0039805EEE
MTPLMAELALPLVGVLVGFVILVRAADRFIEGAAGLARNLGVSPLVVGLTIVGFGTSAPEMLVSGLAAWEGNSGIAIGNALGSNITNLALVLGVTALLIPMRVGSAILRREFPVMLLVMVAALLLLVDDRLSSLDGGLLLAGMVAYVGWLAWLARSDSSSTDPMVATLTEEIPDALSTGRALVWTLVGLVLLLGSARLIVWGAATAAASLGISDLVIGLTVVAIGTSLPELAAALSSARKREFEMALGNVIGSNIFNLLGVLGLPGVIHATAVPAGVLERDFPVMLLLTALVFAFALGRGGCDGHINRREGGILVAVYLGWLTWLLLSPGSLLGGTT